MRKSRKNAIRLPPVKRILPDFFEVPECAYKDVCRIELISDSYMSIEGCGAVLSYDENLVCIRTDGKILQITGMDLTLGGMNTTGIVIKGKIGCISYV